MEDIGKILFFFHYYDKIKMVLWCEKKKVNNGLHDEKEKEKLR